MPSVDRLNIPGRSAKTVYININPKNVQREEFELYSLGKSILPFYIIPSVCIPNWDCSAYGKCQVDNRKYCISAKDKNNCGELYRGNYFEFGALDCKLCVSQWSCSEWSSCRDGLQYRRCYDINNCNASCMSDDCKEARSCGVPPRRSQQKSYAINFYNDITQDDAINSLINPELYEKKELQGFLYVKNTGSRNLTNIAFYLTGNLAEIMVINVTRKNVLEPDEIIHQFIIVNGDKNPRYDEYRGELIASSDELNKSFSMIFVIKRGSREESPLIRQSRSLFTEEVTALPEEDYSVASQP